MQNREQGFTLIELVMVIVILGILAATAIPKFVDLSDEAQTAAVKGVAGSVSGAAAVNYAAYKASDGSKGVGLTGADDAAVCTSANVGSIMQGGFPSGYAIEAGSTALASGVAYCKVCYDDGAGTSSNASNGTCDTGETAVDDVSVILTN